jgi:hypothetical protein
MTPPPYALPLRIPEMVHKLSVAAFLAVVLILPGTAFGQTCIYRHSDAGRCRDGTGTVEFHRMAVHIGATRTAVGGIAFNGAVGRRECSISVDERYGEHGQI